MAPGVPRRRRSATLVLGRRHCPFLIVATESCLENEPAGTQFRWVAVVCRRFWVLAKRRAGELLLAIGAKRDARTDQKAMAGGGPKSSPSVKATLSGVSADDKADEITFARRCRSVCGRRPALQRSDAVLSVVACGYRHSRSDTRNEICRCHRRRSAHAIKLRFCHVAHTRYHRRKSLRNALYKPATLAQH